MKTPVYLDYSSTTPISQEVLEAMMPFLTHNFGNASNKLNYYGAIAGIAVKKARQNVASLINAQEDEIIFTSSATESNNLAIKGILGLLPNDKKHIITCKAEHNSVLQVIKYLESKGHKVSFIEPNARGVISIDRLINAINKETGLISIMHVNNETGVINPILEIAELAKKHNIIFHTDCVQSIDKIPIDVKRDKIDALSFSAHKIYGPKGCGVLYLNNKYFNSLTPILHGGGQEYGLRSGTLNTPAIIGLSKAVDQINTTSNQINLLRDYFEVNLAKSLDIIVNGQNANRIGAISNITFKGVEADRLILRLQSKVACSAGSACLAEKDSLSHVLESMGINTQDIKSTLRFSIGKYTTKAELDYAINAIKVAIGDITKNNKHL